MKIIDILSRSTIDEAYVEPGIISYLENKGYKKLGKGADKVVFLEPGTGLVLLIFGTSRGKSGSDTELTNAQKSFKTFYDLIKADPDNEFLPNIVEYAPFMYDGKPYLQIRMERLFPFKSPSVKNWNEVLADMAGWIESGKTLETFKAMAFRDVTPRMPVHKQISTLTRNETMQPLFMHLGEEGITKLWNTITLLKRVAKKNGYILDLHGGNFMLGSDGTPVVSDPFFMGWNKSS